jgi:hypothetical protein
MSSLHLSSLNGGLSKTIQKFAGTSAGSTTMKGINAAAPGAIHALGKLASKITGQHKGSPLLQQIQESVITALQNAKASGDTTDPNTIVEQTIAKTLGQGLSNMSQTASDTNTAGSTSAVDSSSQQAFLQTLQSYGVDSAHFHTDFLSAVQDIASTQGGDPGAVLKKAPPGLIINLLG